MECAYYKHPSWKEKIQILETQSELAEEALKSWKEKKKADVQSNPGDFIDEANKEGYNER